MPSNHTLNVLLSCMSCVDRCGSATPTNPYRLYDSSSAQFPQSLAVVFAFLPHQIIIACYVGVLVSMLLRSRLRCLSVAPRDTQDHLCCVGRSPMRKNPEGIQGLVRALAIHPGGGGEKRITLCPYNRRRVSKGNGRCRFERHG